MTRLPDSVKTFLDGKNIAVAGVSRESSQPANAIFRKLRAAGYGVFPINPQAREVEGTECFSDLASIPASIHGVVIATHPDVSLEIVRQCVASGVKHVWIHRSFDEGSVSAEAVSECEAGGIDVIVGGCPMMFCEPVDLAHRCMRWFLQWRGRVPR